MKCPNCEKISLCSCSNCKARRNMPRYRSYNFNNSNENIICPYCKSSFYIGYLEDLAIKEYNLENTITINLRKMRTYTEEEVRKAVEFGLWAFDDFDRTSNYDAESRSEGLKEIQDDFIKSLNQ